MSRALASPVKIAGVALALMWLLATPASHASVAPNPEQKLAMIAKPSVVRVFGVYLASYRFNDRDWPVAIGGTGSGFFITGDGYIATNAHVVSHIYEGDGAAQKQLERAFVDEVYKDFGKQLSTMTRSELRELFATAKQTSFKKLSYVVLPNGDKLDYQVKSYGEPGKGKDAAILKVKTTNAPTLPIGDSAQTQVADRIVVIGYPGVADFRALLDERSQLEASVTDGSISAIKRAASGEPILQITAPITHGNSGGPAIDANGNVIGLATFGNESEVQGFNFLVASNTLSEFVAKLKLTPTASSTATLWREGLELFWDQRFTKSIEVFTKVAVAFPAHSEVPRLVKLATEQIKAGKDRSDADDGHAVLIALVLGGVFVIGAVFLVLRKKQAASSTSPQLAAQRPLPGYPATQGQPPRAAPMAPGNPGAQPVQNPFVPGHYPQASAPFAPAGPASHNAPSAFGPSGQPQPMSGQPVAFAPPQANIAKTIAIGQQQAPIAATAFGALAIGSVTCVRGLLQGQRFALSAQGILIGRQPGLAQIVVNDGRASGKHVWIGFENGKLVCIDQGTTNGTFVNDITRGRVSRAELRDGDVVIVAEPDVLSLQVRLS